MRVSGELIRWESSPKKNPAQQNLKSKFVHEKPWGKIKRFFYVGTTFDVTKFLYKLLPTKKNSRTTLACEISRPSSLPARAAFRSRETLLGPGAKKDGCFRRLAQP